MGSSTWKEKIDKFAADIHPGIFPKVYFVGKASGLMMCLNQLVDYVDEI